MSNVKKALLAKCYEQVNQKIATYQNAMRAAQEAANAESKSSAGDKYETTRALMQIEKDNNARQLAEVLKLKKALDQIKPDQAGELADFGSLITTEQQSYFLAISAGIIKLDTKDYIVLSPSSPLGKKLMGLKCGDHLDFNGNRSIIIAVG